MPRCLAPEAPLVLRAAPQRKKAIVLPFVRWVHGDFSLLQRLRCCHIPAAAAAAAAGRPHVRRSVSVSVSRVAQRRGDIVVHYLWLGDDAALASSGKNT